MGLVAVPPPELAFHQIYAAVSKKNATVGLERMAEDQDMKKCGGLRRVTTRRREENSFRV